MDNGANVPLNDLAQCRIVFGVVFLFLCVSLCTSYGSELGSVSTRATKGWVLTLTAAPLVYLAATSPVAHSPLVHTQRPLVRASPAASRAPADQLEIAIGQGLALGCKEHALYKQQPQEREEDVADRKFCWWDSMGSPLG